MRKSVHTRAYKVLQERLVAARQAAGLTQQELATRLGRPQSFVAKYEGGERRLDIVELLSITQLLGIDERRLFKAVKAEF
ncbi:MAG TPA: helix-turn-helix transcriptional regulator [Rhizomicrobium sp.]|nr:helix-turn-helix transcriptional regulator [Rhizomicrobium sp.]